MPNPGKYDSKNSWMDACMHQVKKVEGKPQNQAVAQCLNMWRNKDKKKKSASYYLRQTALDILESKE